MRQAVWGATHLPASNDMEVDNPLFIFGKHPTNMEVDSGRKYNDVDVFFKLFGLVRHTSSPHIATSIFHGLPRRATPGGLGQALGHRCSGHRRFCGGDSGVVEKGAGAAGPFLHKDGTAATVVDT